MRPKYYYRIEFDDGRVIYRAYQTKSMAEAVSKTLEHEMLLFNVKSIIWGKCNVLQWLDELRNLARQPVVR